MLAPDICQSAQRYALSRRRYGDPFVTSATYGNARTSPQRRQVPGARPAVKAQPSRRARCVWCVQRRSSDAQHTRGVRMPQRANVERRSAGVGDTMRRGCEGNVGRPPESTTRREAVHASTRRRHYLDNSPLQMARREAAEVRCNECQRRLPRGRASERRCLRHESFVMRRSGGMPARR